MTAFQKVVSKNGWGEYRRCFQKRLGWIQKVFPKRLGWDYFWKHLWFRKHCWKHLWVRLCDPLWAPSHSFTHSLIVSVPRSLTSALQSPHLPEVLLAMVLDPTPTRGPTFKDTSRVGAMSMWRKRRHRSVAARQLSHEAKDVFKTYFGAEVAPLTRDVVAKSLCTAPTPWLSHVL